MSTGKTIIAAFSGESVEYDALLELWKEDDGSCRELRIRRQVPWTSFLSLQGGGAVAWMTIKESKQHGHHIYSVEAIKVEALDRKVEVVSGNTPHASSASTGNRIAFPSGSVKWGHPVVWIAGSVWAAGGIGKIICNVHEQIEAVKYREMFWGVLGILCGAFLLYVDHILTERRRKS